MTKVPRNQLKQWLPCRTPPMELDAVVSWVDEEGAIFLHSLDSSSLANMETITNLLNSYLAKSVASVEDLHWEKDQPCVIRYDTLNVCTVIVLNSSFGLFYLSAF